MKTVLGVMLLTALLLPVVSFCESPEVITRTSKELKVSSSIRRIDGSMLSVDFAIVSRADEGYEVVLNITSKSDTEMAIAHPANMGTTAFLLMDENGNVIAPVQLDKDQDIAYEDRNVIKLKPGATFRHVLSKSNNRKELLSFLSNTGHFAYTLEFGKTYRMVAVYRPAGIWDVGGVCSPEKKIKFEAHEHEDEFIHRLQQLDRLK